MDVRIQLDRGRLVNRKIIYLKQHGESEKRAELFLGEEGVMPHKIR